MRQYRALVNGFSTTTKKWTTIAWLRVVSFTINEDALAKATSSFEVLEVPDNISIGDVMRVNFPDGSKLYVGVIDKIDGTTITTSQGHALYKGQWIYQTRPDVTGLYHEIEAVMYDYMLGKMYNSITTDPMMAGRMSATFFKAQTDANLLNVTDRSVKLPEEDKTMDFEDFIYSMFDDYTVGFHTLAYLNNGTDQYAVVSTLHFNDENTKIIITDNSRYISNAEVISTTQETNKLVVYDREDNLRAVYYATTEQVTQNGNDPLRVFPMVTKVVVSDDEDLTAVRDANISAKTYNHQLKFDIEIGNPYYTNMFTWESGKPLTVGIEGHVFDTIITGRQITKEANKNITKVTFICGKARTSLTKKLLAQGVI